MAIQIGVDVHVKSLYETAGNDNFEKQASRTFHPRGFDPRSWCFCSFTKAPGNSLLSIPLAGPCAFEDCDTVPTGIVTNWMECESLTIVADCIRPEKRRVRLMAESTIPVVWEWRNFDSRSKFNLPCRLVG